MEKDFLDGIDDTFQSLMKANGNGKRNGQATSRSREDSLISEIVEHLHSLTSSQKEEVLRFVSSLEKQR